MTAKGTTRREHWNPLLKSYPFSEKINAVSIGAETLFTRLVAQADDYGNYFGNSKMILATLFPHRWAKGELTETDVGRWRTELVTCSCGPIAALYTVNDSEYLHIINPRRRFRSDTNPDERFPREPETLEESVLSAYVTKAARKRTVNVPLDQDKTKIRPRQDQGEDYARTDQVIDYLNEKTEASFKHSKASRENIHARLNGDGLSLEECKLLIDYKVAEWLDDPKTAEWLNPETLFRPTKWEKNLNGARRWDARGRPPVSDSKSRRSGQTLNQRSLSEYVGEE